MLTGLCMAPTNYLRLHDLFKNRPITPDQLSKIVSFLDKKLDKKSHKL